MTQPDANTRDDIFTHFRVKMGRPCTAGEIWQRPSMCHALIRMYLYTTLPIEDISKLSTIVGQHRIGSHVASGKRSTAAQLKALLAEKDTRLDPLKLRPGTDDDARERANCWRSEKRYRKEKASRRHQQQQEQQQQQQCMEQETTTSADGNHVRLSWVQRALPHLSEQECSEIRSLLSWRSSQCSTISRSSSTRSHHQISHNMNMNLNHDMDHSLTPLDESLSQQEVDWPEIAPWTDFSARVDGTSWADLPPSSSSMSDAGPWVPPTTAHACVLVNICKRHSLSAGSQTPPPTTPCILFNICCRHRRDCLHQKVEATIRGQYPNPLTNEDLSLEGGRDMFGETIRHIAARWAPVDVFWLLHDKADPKALNVKNVAGNTFLHILGPLFIETQHKFLLDILIDSCQKGFDVHARNLAGENLLSCLLPTTSSSRLDGTRLRGLTNGLQYLLLYTPSSILLPMLLSQSPSRQPQTVARYMEHLLSFHARRMGGGGGMGGNLNQIQSHALSVSRLFGDKVQAASTSIPTTSLPSLPSDNSLHQHLHYLSITPWDIHLASGTHNTNNNLVSVFESLLVKDRADPNEYSTYGTLAMHCAAAVVAHIGHGYLSEKDGVSLLQLLHAYGADFRLVTGNGETPLHMAIRLGLADTVAMLIRLGADLMAFDTKGKSALCYPLVQKALLKGRVEGGGGSRRYASAHRILVSVVDAAVRLGLPRPHNFLRGQGQDRGAGVQVYK